MQQLRIQLALRVPTFHNITSWQQLHEDLKQSFIDSYIKKGECLEMYIQGLGTGTWNLHGRAKLNSEIHLRSARKRIRDLLLRWHERLRLPEPADKAFSKHLETALSVKPDAESFSGDRHCWTILEPTLQEPPAAFTQPVAAFATPVIAGRHAATASRPPPPDIVGSRAFCPFAAGCSCAVQVDRPLGDSGTIAPSTPSDAAALAHNSGGPPSAIASSVSGPSAPAAAATGQAIVLLGADMRATCQAPNNPTAAAVMPYAAALLARVSSGPAATSLGLGPAAAGFGPDSAGLNFPDQGPISTLDFPATDFGVFCQGEVFAVTRRRHIR